MELRREQQAAEERVAEERAAEDRTSEWQSQIRAGQGGKWQHSRARVAKQQTEKQSDGAAGWKKELRQRAEESECSRQSTTEHGSLMNTQGWPTSLAIISPSATRGGADTGDALLIKSSAMAWQKSSMTLASSKGDG